MKSLLKKLAFLTLFLSLSLTNGVSAAITVDSTTYGEGLSGTTVTVPITVPSSGNNILLVCVGYGSNDSVTVTYNGESMTLLQDSGASFQGRTLLFFLGTPDAGSHDVVLTKTNNQAAGVAAIVVSAASSTIGGSSAATGTSTAPSVVVTTSGDAGMVIDCVNTPDGGVLTVGANQTELFNDPTMASNNWDFAGSRETHSGSNVTMSWTQANNQRWAITAAEVVEGIAAGGNDGAAMMMGMAF